jgi:hypothetical protein
MLEKFNFMNRGVGDCRIAGPEYQLRFETANEIKTLAAAIDKEFDLIKKPVFKIKNHSNKCLQAKVSNLTGIITVFNSGANVGVVLHELAHLDRESAAVSNQRRYGRNRISHGRAFKAAQTKFILFWRKNLRNDFFPESAALINAHNDIQNALGMTKVFKAKLVKPVSKPKPQKTKVLKMKTVYHTPKSEVVDTEEDIKELIEVAVEGIARLTVHHAITMGGLVRAMRVRGVANTPDNRNYAKKHAIEIGLRVNTRY